MVDFIYQCHNSMPKPLCDDIIKLFEETEDKHKGTIISGIQPDVKDTTDYIIPKNNDKWTKIEQFLYKELSKNILLYINKPGYDDNYNKVFNLFYKRELITEYFMVQKYNKNEGKYIYHNDFNIDNSKYRVITFLWYLNTVEEGGETEFWNNYKIKPETGKLLLFPATWTYPHTGKMPISNDKYIITGWLYLQI